MQALGPCRVWLSSTVLRLFSPTRRVSTNTSGRVVRESLALTRPAFKPSDPPDEMDPLVSQMLAQNRYTLLLRRQIAESLNQRQFEAASEALFDQTALAPEGAVVVEGWRSDEDQASATRLVRVEAFYLDRFAVTNAHYQRFVEAGGYEDMALWDEEIWPGVLEFVDQTGEPGPRFWRNGEPPANKLNHPVVGVCWYEAAAYARWAGKRLPSDAEWVRAASWPIPVSEGRPTQRKFPWGDAMDHDRANLWGTGLGDTVPVDAFPAGASVGQAYQLVGNVWEWTANNFTTWSAPPARLELPRALKSLRGGAFDTYFSNHAACQFQSGEAPLARKHNIGFRCVVSARELCTTWERRETEESRAKDEILAVRE
jgi:iron(II)-dependent oxidoreductase